MARVSKTDVEGGVALGDEILINGDFSSAANWEILEFFGDDFGFSITGGYAEIDKDNQSTPDNNGVFRQDISSKLEVGKTYRCTFDATIVSAGQTPIKMAITSFWDPPFGSPSFPSFADSEFIDIPSSGSYSFDLTTSSNATNNFYFVIFPRGSSPYEGILRIDNISLKEIVYVTPYTELTIETLFNQLTVQSLYSFINSEASTYLTQEFTYSKDNGSTYEDYATLTQNNIETVDASINDQLVVKYKYTVNTTPSVTGDVVIRGQYSQLIYPFFDNTFFAEFFDLNDPGVLQWALSVLEKIYGRGELADYMDRGAGESLFEDKDFIAFWYTACHFMAIIVIYNRVYEDIRSSEVLLRYFLDNVGIYYSRDNTLTELQWIFDNYVGEFEVRGTEKIYRDKTETHPYGELLRLLNYTDTEEFLFALTEPKNFGWCIGTSSPCYTGTESIANLVKAYEFTDAATNLSLYPVEGLSYVSIDGDYMSIENIPSGSIAGISSIGDSSNKIIISPDIDYEVSFKIIKGDSEDNVTFGVTAYDAQGNEVDLLSNQDGNSTNIFFEDKNPAPVIGTEYWVRGVIFNKDTSDTPGETLQIGIGNNLRFQGTAVSIIPNIRVEGDVSGTNQTKIKDIKIRPRALPISQGMLGGKNIIVNYIQNNSGMNDEILAGLIKKYLLPYNCTYYPISIEQSEGTGNLLLNSGGYILLNSGGKIII